MNEPKAMCPLCELDLLRVPAFHEQLYPKFHIYTCVLWSDVYHAVAASLGAEIGGARLVRPKVEK